MKALVTLEDHLWRRPDGGAYVNGPHGYSSWSQLLEAFDEVLLVARMQKDDCRSCGGVRVDGGSVSVRELPDYAGPWQYLRKLPELRARARQSVEQCDVYILRGPGLVGRLVWKQIKRLGRPYALEVVGDPWDALGPRSVHTAFRPILRRLAVRDLRAMCQGALAVHYVTRESLQRRYPAARGAYSVGFSDWVSDGHSASASDLKKRLARIESAAAGGGLLRIGFVGSLAQPYKGLDVLLHAIALSRSWGVDIEIAVVGDGRYLAQMKSIARRLGIEGRATFLGQIPFGKAVFDFLDSIDLFVMPSYAEGLPRALLEAMLRGCPCIATNVGGIPELLSSEDMVPAGEVTSLAEKIREASASPLRLRQMAERNLARAKEFNPEVLTGARLDFLRFVRAHARTA